MITERLDLKEVLTHAADKLVSVQLVGTSAVVSVPVLYPSGAASTVNVSQHSNRFFVSDMGYGFQEAEMIGAGGSYLSAARKISDTYGVRFDNQSFFVSEASAENLTAVITIIANCSVEAANIAAVKASERSLTKEFEAFHQRLTGTFEAERVVRNAEIFGSSSRKWTVSSKVQLGGERVILFDTVSKNHNSVVNSAIKFHDISRLSNPPRRFTVVKSLAEMESYVNLLAQSSEVVEADISADQMRQLVA